MCTGSPRPHRSPPSPWGSTARLRTAKEQHEPGDSFVAGEALGEQEPSTGPPPPCPRSGSCRPSRSTCGGAASRRTRLGRFDGARGQRAYDPGRGAKFWRARSSSAATSPGSPAAEQRHEQPSEHGRELESQRPDDLGPAGLFAAGEAGLKPGHQVSEPVGRARAQGDVDALARREPHRLHDLGLAQSDQPRPTRRT